MTIGELRFELTQDYPGIHADRIDAAINGALESIELAHDWKDLEASTRITTVAIHNAGTVSVTQGSATVTGSGTGWTAGMTGRRFRVYGRPEWYTFTYVSATQGTLDRVVPGASASAQAYLIYQPAYALPADFREPRQATNELLAGALDFVPREEFDRRFGGIYAMGEPLAWTLLGGSDLELAPIPQAARSYPLLYVKRLTRFAADASDTVVPGWISIEALKAGAAAKLDPANLSAHLALRDAALRGMLRTDAAKRGPSRIRTRPRSW